MASVYIDKDAKKNTIDNNSKETAKVTWVGLIVNVFLVIAKLAVGMIAQSKALIADAIHSFSDLITDLAILLGIKYWNAPPDTEHPYGHRRIEVLVTIVIGIFLLMAGVFLGYEAVQGAVRFYENNLQNYKVQNNSYDVVLVAALSIAVKEILYRWTLKKAKKIKSSALAANAWHHRSDALSSIPVLATATINSMFEISEKNAYLLDNIAALVVCIMIIQAALKITMPAVWLLVDESASIDVVNKIKKIALTTNGVLDTHKIRTKVISSSAVFTDLHILVDGNISVTEGHNIAGKVKSRLLSEVDNLVDVIIHVEPK